MRNLVIAVLLLGSWTLGADPLWDKASKLLETSKAWKPTLTVTTSLDLDSSGKVNETVVMTTRYGIDAQGRTTRQNIRVVKNGKEDKPDAVATATPAPKDPTDPLEAAAQPFVKLEPASAASWKGTETMVYRYTFLPSGGWGLKGKIWIDKATGVAIHRESELSPKPPFVDTGNFVQETAWDPRGFARTDSIVIDFSGSFLGLKKAIRMTSEVKDYARAAGTN
ncbi:MAG: hypothetical protein WCG80_17210 [Spirochaetales bacterium]